MAFASAGERIASELRTLALSGASGVMEIEGDLSGAIYLDRGDLTFAESSGAPDLAARLIGSRRLSARQWDLEFANSRPPDKVGDLLVERGFISSEDLRPMLQSVVLDAVITLGAPWAGGSSAASVRFVPQERQPVGSVLRFNIESICVEATAAVERLGRHNIRLNTCLELSDLSRPWAIMTCEQWALACRIDGLATVRDLAWRLGFAIHETVEWAAGLVSAGLCVPAVSAVSDAPPRHGDVGRSRPDQDRRLREEGEHAPHLDDAPTLRMAPVPSAAAGTDEAAGAHSDDGRAKALLPHRAPGTTRWIMTQYSQPESSAARELEQVMKTPPRPVNLDLLHRVLQGLKRLD